MKRFMVGVLVFFALGCVAKHDTSKIEPASEKQLALIAKGLDPKLTIVKSCAVRSKNYKRAYYVSALIHGPRIADVGVWWISGDKEKPGLVLAVDGFAIVYSSYPKASNTRVGARTTDDEVKLLKGYLKVESEAEIKKNGSTDQPSEETNGGEPENNMKDQGKGVKTFSI